jgi:hypothetical protein
MLVGRPVLCSEFRLRLRGVHPTMPETVRSAYVTRVLLATDADLTLAVHYMTDAAKTHLRVLAII